MSTLSPLDVALVAVYIVGTTLLGSWFARRQRDVRTYFVGDRNVGWGLVLVSIVATETSTVTFLSVPGVAFNPQGGDLTFLQLALGYVAGRAVIAWFLLPHTVADGLRLYLTALLLGQLTGWDLRASVLAAGLVTLAYTYLGGMQA